MDLICSTFKVTLGAVILVDYTHYMEFEPKLSADPVEQVTRGLRASYGKANNRGGIVHTWEFSRVAKHTDIVEAQRALLTLAETMQGLEGACTIEFKAGAYVHSMANASLGSVRGDARHCFTFHTLRITGGQLTTTT